LSKVETSEIENRMHILVTNDDGILAPGILALRRAVADLGK